MMDTVLMLGYWEFMMDTENVCLHAQLQNPECTVNPYPLLEKYLASISKLSSSSFLIFMLGSL